MYACICETEAGFFEQVCAPSNASAYLRDPPHNTKEPESCCQGSGPKRITSRATVEGGLAWGRGRPPPAQCPNIARMPPRTTRNVVHTSLKASQAGALLVRTRSLSSHDHAINSSTSWS